MNDEKPGPKPEAEIEPGEPNPGGADAIDAGEPDPPVADLDPERNPAVEDALPDEMKMGEDTSTKATESSGDKDDSDSDSSDRESSA